MSIFVIICYSIIGCMALAGFIFGLVKVITPIISGCLSLLVLFMLKKWAFGFLFKWAFFGGENIGARIVVIVLTVIALMLLFRWLLLALKIISKIPIISSANRILGLAAGLLEGIMIVWIIFYVMQLFPYVEMFSTGISQVQNAQFLNLLLEKNLIQYLMETFTYV